MNVDFEMLAKWATALIAIISFAKLIVTPFQRAMTANKQTMKSLEDTIKELVRDLRDSQKDRENIHKVLDKHSERLGKVEDEVIRIDTYCNVKKIDVR